MLWNGSTADPIYSGLMEYRVIMRISYIIMTIENGITIFFSEFGYKRWLKENIQQMSAIGMNNISINTPMGDCSPIKRILTKLTTPRHHPEDISIQVRPIVMYSTCFREKYRDNILSPKITDNATKITVVLPWSNSNSLKSSIPTYLSPK